MPTVSNANLEFATNVEDAQYAAEFVKGCKIAAARGCFIACLFFSMRVVFFMVTGSSPSLATSLICAGVGLAFVGGVLYMAARYAGKPLWASEIKERNAGCSTTLR